VARSPRLRRRQSRAHGPVRAQGCKPVLTVSLSVAVAAYVLISLGIELRSLALIAIGCLIGGLAESNIAIAQSAISDVAGPDERPRLIAWIYSCCSLGYIAGPVIGGQLVVLLGWSAPFWLTAPLLGATLGWIWIGFRETHPPEQGRRFDVFAALTNLAGVFTDRALVVFGILLIGAGLVLAFSASSHRIASQRKSAVG
jgi:MFS family permease